MWRVWRLLGHLDVDPRQTLVLVFGPSRQQEFLQAPGPEEDGLILLDIGIGDGNIPKSPRQCPAIPFHKYRLESRVIRLTRVGCVQEDTAEARPIDKKPI